MTADDIQIALMYGSVQKGFVLPNYTPHNWFECDVFYLTANGYMREYEIKLTRADFRADAEKKREMLGEGFRLTGEVRGKHELLAAGDVRGPTRFWFVCPKGMIQQSELPKFAGLLEIGEHSLCKGWERVWVNEVVKAPTLHRKKADPKIKKHAEGVCYYRLHALMRSRNQVTKDTDSSWKEETGANLSTPAREQVS